MNNEFEKNSKIEKNTENDASEVMNSDNVADTEVCTNKASEPTVVPPSDASAPTDIMSEAYSNASADISVTEEKAGSVPRSEPEAMPSASHNPYIRNEEPVMHDSKSTTPGGDSYFYSKTDSKNSDAVGCVWDSSANNKPKKKSGVSGFRVFTAAMLSVFTVSAVTVAGFLVADYLKDKDTATVVDSSITENKQVSYAAPTQSHTSYPSEMVSSVNIEGTALTKSQVAAKCSPSAVGIVVEQETTYSNSFYGFPYFGNYGNPGGTQIVEGTGSGFIYSADGYIITNHHVIENATKITVHFYDGTTAEAELVGSDSLSDIAVIKIDATDRNLVPMEIGDSSLMNVGDEVIAIGCPAGIEFMGTVTDGIISAINRNVELENDGSSTTKTMTLLQTNATINRGNSGGPLINSGGQVIGINTLKLSADYEGIGFSIPINGALPIISQLIEHGKVVERTESFVSSEGVIGISASDITEQESNYYEIPQGVLVVQIDRDSSAAKAGLRRGDIITKFNGEVVKTTNELNTLKASFKAGDEVTLTIYRDSDDSDKTIDITFKLDMAS